MKDHKIVDWLTLLMVSCGQTAIIATSIQDIIIIMMHALATLESSPEVKTVSIRNGPDIIL